MARQLADELDRAYRSRAWRLFQDYARRVRPNGLLLPRSGSSIDALTHNPSAT